MKIVFIGKFTKMWDEEYIAQGFEHLGHTVIRLDDKMCGFDISANLLKQKPDMLLYCKWDQPVDAKKTIEKLQKEGMKTVCWLFDLYLNYNRAYQLNTRSFFKSDFVFTTDGGKDDRFAELGINHKCIRQGIRTEECFMQTGNPVGVAFIGSDNPLYPFRQKMLGEVMLKFKNFTWYGRGDSDEVRGVALNTLFANTKIIIGDAVYSPNYWSNRVVETLGRGGFLVHPEVEGIKQEYPYLVTYRVGDIQDLINKVSYYLNHEDERRELVKKNFEWVRDNYTVEKKCEELINYVFPTHNNQSGKRPTSRKRRGINSD